MTGISSPRFRAGDVVRRTDRSDALAVVVDVADHSADGNPPMWVLEVDAAYGGRVEGICMWSSGESAIANDDDSVAEARRLGLRGLH